MPNMTDPMDALVSFQAALLAGQIDLQRCVADSDLYVHADRPNGMSRLSYVRLEGRVVTAFVNFVSCDPVEGTHCFQVGYAVPERYRGQDRAKDIVSAAIAEMQVGLGRNGISHFYVEAIVGVDNLASQRVAEQTISSTSTAITDDVSSQPALQYLREVSPPSS